MDRRCRLVFGDGQNTDSSSLIGQGKGNMSQAGVVTSIVIPIVAVILVGLLLIIIVIVLCRRRRSVDSSVASLGRFGSIEQCLLRIEDLPNEISLPNPTAASQSKSSEDRRWNVSEQDKVEGEEANVISIDQTKVSVFRLSLVMWELETDLVPFAELDAVNASRQMKAGVMPLIHNWEDEPFADLIRECLSLAPDDRPSLDDVKSRLESLNSNPSPAPLNQPEHINLSFRSTQLTSRGLNSSFVLTHHESFCAYSIRMGNIINKMDTYSNATCSDLSSSDLPFSTDCSPFLRWEEDQPNSESEKAVLFQSLVSTVKLHPAHDVSLEAKAVKLLNSVNPKDGQSADALLSHHASASSDSSTDFVLSMVVLISSGSHAITTATMEMLEFLVLWCSTPVHLSLVKADLIPQLIASLNPQSLPFDKAVDIHINVMNIVVHSIWLSTPDYLAKLEIEDDDEQQAVHETVLKQVLVPSEKYIWHLCTNRYSIIDEDLSDEFMTFISQFLLICPYYQPTMDFIVHIPVALSIPSCLSFYDSEDSHWGCLYFIMDAQRDLNKTRREERQMGEKVHRMLRMEGIEDVIEEKLQNDKNGTYGGWTADNSIRWSNQLGVNIPL
ncbi:hypothetical protein BLNAU_10477 [Blattamonas nauphoetae]|uniref:Protein kinase domain-containing protein n=1 Tax=Blattamonas nauphoetae TaxID=2049346 RepID=A0ABQ9XT28_9EUKA|nr:hypothetical protein BLNAU_10477 [Blattamonas nauphoetae]